MPALQAVKVKLKRSWRDLPEHRTRMLDREPRYHEYCSRLPELVWRIVLDPTAIRLAEFHGTRVTPRLTLLSLSKGDQPPGQLRILASDFNANHGVAPGLHGQQDPAAVHADVAEFRQRYGWPLRSTEEVLALKETDPNRYRVNNWLFREMAFVLRTPQYYLHYFSPDLFEPVRHPKYTLTSETTLGDTTTAVYRHNALASNA